MCAMYMCTVNTHTHSLCAGLQGGPLWQLGFYYLCLQLQAAAGKIKKINLPTIMCYILCNHRGGCTTMISSDFCSLLTFLYSTPVHLNLLLHWRVIVLKPKIQLVRLGTEEAKVAK